MEKETADYLLKLAKEMDNIEDVICWNLSFDIPYEETLKEIDRLDLLDYFSYLNDNELTDTGQETKDSPIRLKKETNA
jgi:hypothetical protein